MSFAILLLLAQDGLGSGIVYALLALSILVVVLVTRVLWVPAGDILVLSALTFATLQNGEVSGTVWLVGIVGGLGAVAESWWAWRAGDWSGWWRRMLIFIGAPLVVGGLIVATAPMSLPSALQALLVIALITPLGYMIFRLGFRHLAESSGLTLLFVAVAVHYILTGMQLAVFGPEAYQAQAFIAGRLDLGFARVSYQLMIIAAVAALVMMLLWYLVGHTLWGRALRATAVNRFGASLVGIQTDAAGALAFTLATAIGALSGVLIGATAPLYFDSGFLIALKGFVGAVVGGLASFPLAVVGAIFVGLFETLASFYASSFKEAIVFGLLIPFLIWRSVLHRRLGNEE